MTCSSSSDFKILIITSSKEKSPGPVNAIEVAEAKYKSKSSSKKILISGKGLKLILKYL